MEDEKINTSGYYKKLEDGTWLYAAYEIICKEYIITIDEKNEIDGWKYYEESPPEYNEWKNNIHARRD